MWLFIAILALIQAPANSADAIEQKTAANPETFMNVSQMICHRGYPSEEYEVLTRDGYYVRLNRIPHGRENPRNSGAKPVVFLQHGLLGEGSHWVENLANNSLGFILADSGYDVWLGNSRGTSWSRGHQRLSADQAEFWDFRWAGADYKSVADFSAYVVHRNLVPKNSFLSCYCLSRAYLQSSPGFPNLVNMPPVINFHEMAMYDLPAMIDFVLQKTGQKQMYYIGHSQGCTIAFIAFSSMPELAQKIKAFFALAPAVTLKYAKSPVLKVSFLLNTEFIKSQLPIGRTDALLWRFLPELCRHPLLQKPCAKLFFLMGGCNEKNFNMTRLDVYTSHYPDTTSVKNMIHWAQVIKSGEFKAFDYGSNNPAMYHQETPPSYRVEEMPVPTAVWSGGEDWLADPRDVRLLLPRIAHLITYGHIPDWNHWDFIWGLDAPERLYSSIQELMEGSR